jgi:hypothetical protein
MIRNQAHMMIRCSVAAALAVALSAGAASAQLELPRPSPQAKVSQMVGLTEVAVDYASPGVKARTIWGSLVPFDQLWRTGANSPTKVTLGKDVTIDGKQVPAGTYSLFTIPTKGAWTVVLNKNANAGTGNYKQAEDALRFSVTPKAIPHRERLAFIFNDTTDEATSLDLEWEKVRVSIPIKANTSQQALANIKSATTGAWRPFNAAARYLMDKKDLDGALKLADQSIAMHEDWFNVWTRAQILSAKGKHKEAHAAAQKAHDLGKKSEMFFFEADVKKALAEWKKK